MKELNLEVGQKVWSIQSGTCVLIDIDKNEEYCFITLNKQGRRNCYDKFGMYGDDHFYPSLFESNPFESKKKHFDFITLEEPKQNKAELINALRLIYKDCFDTDIKIIAKDKLQKLLESL